MLRKWKKPARLPTLFVDNIIEKNGKLLLLNREIYPFQGKLDYPAGMVEYGETVEKAAAREALEETGFKVKPQYILGVYSTLERDPRFHAATVVFISKIVGGKLKSSFEGKVSWYDIKKIKPRDFGFDHGTIFKNYLRWKKRKGTYWSTKK
jgi:ADP-ribose pyrophosphatase YjhB (NUDIX family)